MTCYHRNFNIITSTLVILQVFIAHKRTIFIDIVNTTILLVNCHHSLICYIYIFNVSPGKFLGIPSLGNSMTMIDFFNGLPELFQSHNTNQSANCGYVRMVQTLKDESKNSKKIKLP